MNRSPLAERFIAELNAWDVPAVTSEAELDKAVRDFVRSLLKSEVPKDELKQWVAGHKEEKPDNRFWSKSKAYHGGLVRRFYCDSG